MSFRTILVGILAAICGVSATVGVNLLNRQKPTTSTGIVVARMNIGYGVKLTKEMVQLKEWPANLLPPGGITNIDDAIDKYAMASMIKDEPILEAKINIQPTNLNIPDGYRGVAIQTPDESSAVGRLIVPGNRVDVILTITQRHEVLGGPATITLLENVEVLAVGQRFEQSKSATIEPEKDTKSVTLLVRPEMAEDINLGAEIGKLHLSLRAPTDDENVEPRTVKSISDIIAQAQASKSTPEPGNPVLAEVQNQIGGLLKDMLAFKNELNQKFDALNTTTADQSDLNAHRRIPDKMRAVTLETPSESIGVAGLVQPGNRVDVLLTLDARKRSYYENTKLSTMPARSVTLLENVEVLAVDTKLIETEGDGEPKMSKSVTMLVTPQMAQDINLANELGTLALTLRGTGDEATDGPRRATVLDDLLEPISDPKNDVVSTEPDPQNAYQLIRLNRGGFSQDIRVYPNGTQAGGR